MGTAGRNDCTRAIAGSLALLAAASSQAFAQSSVSRTFSVRDGLVHERVNDFLEDRFGFLWIATWEGASRFDGRSFVSYGPADGLASPLVWCIGESPTGRIWLGTSTGGLARLRAGEDANATAFEPLAISSVSDENTVESMAFAPDGALLLETPFGVRRCDDPDAARPRFDLIYDAQDRHWDAQAIARVGDTTWFLRTGRCAGIRGRDVRTLDGPPGQPLVDAVHAQPRADGSCLIASTEGIFAFEPAALANGASPWRRLDVALPTERVHTLAWSDDGTIWIGTVRGLLRIRDGAAEPDRRVDRIDANSGMQDEYVRAALLDPRGALWIGTELGGIALLRRGPIESFVPSDRRGPLVMLRIAEAVDGTIFASATNAGLWRVDGSSLRSVPGSEAESILNCHMRFARDRVGRFWIGTDDGLLRTRGTELDLSALERVPFGDGDARVNGEIFFDAEGGVWIGGRDGALYHGDATASPPRALERTPFPAAPDYPPRAFGESEQGRVWIAPADHLWYRAADGAFRPLELRGLPEPLRPRCVVPKDGRTWVGTRYDGALWLAPDDALPDGTLHLTTKDGLPSDFVATIAMDDRGAVWLGTARGLVRRDPVHGTLRRFGPGDGLAGSTVNHLLKDRTGALWAATAGGLSRIDPRALEPAAQPPRLYVSHVEAGGEPTRLASRGLREVGGIEAPASRRDLVAEFTAVDLDGGLLHFEHRLEGLDERFSPPHAESSVRYAGLAPGHYVLEMIAVNADGVASEPARVAFEVLAPFWRQPWFVATALLAVVGSAVALHRMRVQRALALERIRTQIATDLHDDAGANLAQIAILSEVARRDAAPGAARTLADVAELARTTRASIADLVWAVDPRRDTLLDLVQRVRQVALNLLEPLGVQVEFTAPASESLAAIELDPASRRHLLFLLQELLHNVARHSEARRVELELMVDGARMRWRVRDDGRGFELAATNAAAASGAGHGLPSARRRAASLGAKIEWTTAPGRGTEVILELELGRRPRGPRILVRWNGRVRRDRMDA